MTPRRLALVMAAALYLSAPVAFAEPILKPHKYSGPIPQHSISLRIGTFGGASNQEMIDYLDGRVRPPFDSFPEDFGNALTIEAAFINKPHPRFGVRLNGSASFFSYTSTGDFVPQVPADSLLPQLRYNRELSVDLIVVEASGIYYFADASVQEFQTYAGAGFSVGFPHEVYSESRTDVDTGQPFTDEIPGRVSEASEWGVSAGVHAVLGMLYYLNSEWAISAEGRIQMMEGRFDGLEALDPDTNDYENVGFVIDYTGFYLSVGATYNF